MRHRRAFALFLAAAIAGCSKRAEPLPAAQAFFDEIAQGRIAAAYASAAFGFQAQQTEQVFAAAVREMGLT